MTNAPAIRVSPLNVPLLATLVFLVTQAISAVWVAKSLEPPNAAGLIARQLAHSGEFSCPVCGTRLYGRGGGIDTTVRMFQLPALPLYLAAAFRYAPEALLRFLQLPFNALLVFASTWMAQRLAGPVVAAMAGAIAIFEPFVFVHGPVWDDTFSGAALTWAVFAILLAALGERPARPGRLALVALLAGAAALMRTSSQLLLLLVGSAGLVLRPLRPIRLEALAAIAGVVLALSAWGYRNYLVMGHFEVGDTHSGISFWESVYPSARESLLTQGQVENLNDERMQDDFAKTSSLGELGAHRYFLHRAVQYILAHPLDVAWTAVVKIGVGLLGLKTTESFWSLRNVVSWSSNLVLFALAAWGILAWPAIDSGYRTLWVLIVSATLLLQGVFMVLGPVALRYRMDFEPILWMLAAAGLAQRVNRTPDTA